jgi:DNA-binding NtrC family response regulator
MKARVLVVDDEKHSRLGLKEALLNDYEVLEARNAEEAFTLLDQGTFEVVLTDMRMAGASGMSVIDHCITLPYKPLCIMMTAYGNVETAVEAMKRGAFDFLPKPVNIERLRLLIERGLHSQALSKENAILHERLNEKYGFHGMIGQSSRFTHVIEQIKQVAPFKTTVLILGQTGTGKERIAQLIHQESPRAKQPFVAVHCAALPAQLLESELFGHEKGAFTGASERRMGRFELAHGGTLFLDEIGEIDASVQVKLLRFLETKSFERVGSNQTLNVDIRLICATHRNIEAMVREGRFREDLLYRLSVVKICLPSLAERQEDIPLLMQHYLKHFGKENKVRPPVVTPEAMQVLLRYPWPGNIRELRNFCENSVVLFPNGTLSVQDLEHKFIYPGASPNGAPLALSSHTQPPFSSGLMLPQPVATAGLPRASKGEAARKMILDALEKTHGKRSLAAQLLGISRRTLYRKLKDWEGEAPHA